MIHNIYYVILLEDVLEYFINHQMIYVFYKMYLVVFINIMIRS
jgi:hypothetical protein